MVKFRGEIGVDPWKPAMPKHFIMRHFPISIGF